MDSIRKVSYLGGRAARQVDDSRIHSKRPRETVDNPIIRRMGDSNLVVNRWRRFGHDRLYVTRADETKVGWWDLKTAKGYPESPADVHVLAEAVSTWKSSQLELAEPGPSSAAPVQTAERPPTPPQATEALVARPWLDLATNLPGAEAREQALAARDAAPVKAFLARALGVHTAERGWRIGADGEEKVAARLAKLARKDPRWRILHAIPVGARGADIDHLVIGPAGVFTLNAKHHPDAKIWVGGDTFLVDGHKQPYIRNSRHEAARAAKLLTEVCGFSVHVEGVVVTVNAKDIVVKKAPNGVHVVPRMQVAKWLSRHGDIHPESVLETIYDAARRSTTWR